MLMLLWKNLKAGNQHLEGNGARKGRTPNFTFKWVSVGKVNTCRLQNKYDSTRI